MTKSAGKGQEERGCYESSGRRRSTLAPGRYGQATDYSINCHAEYGRGLPQICSVNSQVRIPEV